MILFTYIKLYYLRKITTAVISSTELFS